VAGAHDRKSAWPLLYLKTGLERHPKLGKGETMTTVGFIAELQSRYIPLHPSRLTRRNIWSAVVPQSEAALPPHPGFVLALRASSKLVFKQHFSVTPRLIVFTLAGSIMDSQESEAND
jgi:hypothetical protein